MPPAPENDPGSMLLVEDCFASANAGFLPALRKVNSAPLLAAFADRWKKDSRPWAKTQLLAYLEQPMNCPGHQPLVKRLFKEAEARKDHELMGAFLVAFDTLVRRVRRQRYNWDRSSRSSYYTEYLSSPHNTIPPGPKQRWSYRDPKTGKQIEKRGYWRRSAPGGRLFTYRTRFYLRRRAWRYFRWLGYAQPAAFPAAIAPALGRYRDEDLAKGENILDSWALLNICFRGCAGLEFRPNHLRLKAGHTLAELHAAPRFAKAWETPEAVLILIQLVAEAKAHLVRMWAMELYRKVSPGLEFEISPELIFTLLSHDNDVVQQFAAELLEGRSGLEKLPLEMWLRLLRTENLTALGTICALFAKHVSGERLSLAQSLKLACEKPVPVARLGQKLLTQRRISAEETPALAALADAECPAVAAELCTWALERVGAREAYQTETVSRFFDSLQPETRATAWKWLLQGSAGYGDAALWSRLAETPFEDLRLLLIDHLALRTKAPALSADDLAPVWSAVLLGVHRGGRQKLKATRQIAEALAREPNKAEQLLPVLAVAVRSIRGPEMRAGLCAVLTLLARRPELQEAVRVRLPELTIAAPLT